MRQKYEVATNKVVQKKSIFQKLRKTIQAQRYLGTTSIVFVSAGMSRSIQTLTEQKQKRDRHSSWILSCDLHLKQIQTEVNVAITVSFAC